MENDETSPRGGFRVVGRVQGVGFRWWTRRTADEFGLSGSVRNLPDGSVEIRAAGNAKALEEFAERLKTGPTAARVRSVERFEVDVVPPGGFRIER